MSGPSNQDNLLWIDETPNDEASKAKRRPKIRAHVRRTVAKKFKLNHKAASQRQYPSLAASPPGYPDIIMRSTKASRRAPFCYNEECPLRYFHTSPHQTACKACGQELFTESTATGQGNDRQLAKLGLLGKTSSLATPQEILGAGRVDPFSSYPIEKPKRYLHDLVDHYITYLLPGLFPDDSEPSTPNPVVKAWFSSSLKYPFLFHSLVFSSAVHLDFVHTSNTFPDSPRVLSHKLFVIQQLNDIISEQKDASIDEVILTVFILAANEVFLPSDGKASPFNPPLKNFRWMDLYGHVSCIPQHMKALYDLLVLRGGVENIKLPGLAEIMVCADVITATGTSSKPLQPKLKSTQIWVTALKTWAFRPPMLPPLTGFQKMKDDLTYDMLDVLNAIAALTLALDYCLKKKLAGLRVAVIDRARCPIQHSLLSLPNADELAQKDGGTVKLRVYECCRLSTLIYGSAVVFPVPNTYQIFQDLVASLKVSIELFEVENHETDSAYPDWLLWTVVLGGIASRDKLERRWYVSRLVKISKQRHLISWESVEVILRTFLWLDSACGPGGRLLWAEVMEVEATTYSVNIKNKEPPSRGSDIRKEGV